MAIDLMIRWLIRRDMQEVLRIESSSFEYPWTDEDFLCCLRQRNCIGMVAEHDYKVVGFMIYELCRGKLNILNFAVHPDFRRRGVGAGMVERLRDKLHQQRRTQLLLELRESNLDGQMFFRSQGFKAVSVLREHYTDTNEDCYVMQFKLPVDSDLSPLGSH